MELHWLRPLLGRPAPFTTVYLDATRADAAGDSEVLDRWRALRRDLERAGAPVAVVAELEERVSRPSGVRGPHGRVLVADAEGVRIDRVLREPPEVSSAVCGPAPALLPAARAADESTRFLLVEIDRQGADLTWVDGSWSDGAGQRTATREVVDGDHDVLHKDSERGKSHRRLQTRAEDSWERNAATVAADLDRQVAQRLPEVVLVTGDVRAVALLRDAVGTRVRDLWVEVPGGSRADGVHQEAFAGRVEAALADHRQRRRADVLERFRTEQGRGAGAVTELGDVVAVLQRGQVAELVLDDAAADPGSVLAERMLWVGPDPLQIAVSKDDLRTIGVEGGEREMPAGVALLRAALGQDAGLTFAADGAVDLVDGVGALLRWSDESTPSEAVPSQSADQARLRRVV
ncbi:baeRF2 domain-containing protein [Cellulomonas hominis]